MACELNAKLYANAGLEFDTTSAGALAASLRGLKDDPSNAATAEVLQLMFTKPMQVRGCVRSIIAELSL